MAAARQIMNISKKTLSMMLMPKIGNAWRNNGSSAQWMAQASEALIPKASQLNLNPAIEPANLTECNFVAKDLLK